MNEIIQLLETFKSASAHQIAEHTGKSRQYVHRVLKKMLDNNQVIKLGSAPFVYYQLVVANNESNLVAEPIASYDSDFLGKHFIQITEFGKLLQGSDAMQHWCKRQKLPLQKTIDEYTKTRKKYLAYFDKNHLIDGSQKLKSTKGLGEIGLDKLYYLDFYAIERFGKTRLGMLMHFAKQGQNKWLMKMIVDEINARINQLIKKAKIDAVCYVAPTIKRQVQIMKYLEKQLKIKLPHVQVKKVSNKIVIPQKALSKIYERVNNARMSFVNIEPNAYNKVLLIDDAVGSGATMNEIAQKLKQKGTAKKVFGLAITGSYKGFEVISEL